MFALPVSLSGLWLSLLSKGSVKCDGLSSKSLNVIMYNMINLQPTRVQTRSLQLCWPTLWKLRWGPELSALVLSPLLDTLHFHLLQASEGVRKTLGGSILLGREKKRVGLCEGNRWVGGSRKRREGGREGED